MTSAYTAGPWMQSGTTVYALEHDGWAKGVETFRNRFYASVQRGPDTPVEELEADAYLIAAAPDLLDALQMVKHLVDVEGTHEQFAQVCAAITKATRAAV